MAELQKSKQFTYNLRTLLKVREIHEKQEEEKFAQKKREFEEEKRKEEEVKEFQNQKYNELRETMSPGKGKLADVNEIMQRRAHLEVVAEQVEEQVKKREDAAEAKEEQRLRMVQAVKEKKIIETDKDRKNVKWRKMMDKEEAKFLDDISNGTFVRNKIASEEESGQ